MSTKKIVLVVGDDWRGLYIDGQLVQEGQDIPVSDALGHLGIPVTVLCADNEWLENEGNLPDKLADVRKESP